MDAFYPYLWLAVIIAAIIVKAVTSQLVSIWFVGGGIAALIASIFDAPFWLQLTSFVVITGILLVATRPMVNKMLAFKKESTNADRYVGKEGIVIEQIDNTAAQGQVKVLGNIWTARSADGSVIPVGANVTVLRIEGVKLLVELKI